MALGDFLLGGVAAIGSGIGDFVGGIWDDVSGVTAAEAATEAAQIQADAATAAAEQTRDATAQQIQFLEESRDIARQDLQPFVEFGTGFMGDAQQAIAGANQLFTDPSAIMANPMFAAIQDDVRRQNLQNAAVRGRLGTGGTLAGLEQSALRTGFDILNSERAAQLQNASFLANLVGQGQNAAAGQGSASLQTGGNVAGTIGQSNATIGNLLTSAAASQAAGVIGAANASTQGTQNLINLGTTIGGALFGAPTGI